MHESPPRIANSCRQGRRWEATMGRRAEIELTAEEREVLERWARRPKSAQALALRCRIVLAAAAGESTIDIAARLGCSRGTVSKWRGRFAAPARRAARRAAAGQVRLRPTAGRPVAVTARSVVPHPCHSEAGTPGKRANYRGARSASDQHLYQSWHVSRNGEIDFPSYESLRWRTGAASDTVPAGDFHEDRSHRARNRGL